MTANPRLSNPFWSAVAKGKSAEWAVQSKLYQLAWQQNLSLNLYPAALDWAGIDALLVIDHQIFALAIQARGTRVQLTTGDTPISSLIDNYKTIVMTVCQTTGMVMVASHELIEKTLKQGKKSIPTSNCLSLCEWLRKT